MSPKAGSKAEIRAAALAARDGIDPELRPEKNARIRENLLSLDEYERAGSILLYVSFRTEVDTLRAIRLSLDAGKAVVLPKVNPAVKTLSLYRIRDLNDLVSGYMGIPEPGILKNRETSLDEIELVVLPGVAFDSSGNRIGYGGGYYDRLLAALDPAVPTVALAYAEQLVDSIPAAPHDRPVRKIVTDEGILACR